MAEELKTLAQLIFALFSISERRRGKRYELWAKAAEKVERVHVDYLMMVQEVREALKPTDPDVLPSASQINRAVLLVRNRRVALVTARDDIAACARMSIGPARAKSYSERELAFLYALRRYLFAGSLDRGPSSWRSQSAELISTIRQSLSEDDLVSADFASNIDEFAQRLERNYRHVAEAFLALELSIIERSTF